MRDPSAAESLASNLAATHATILAERAAHVVAEALVVRAAVRTAVSTEIKAICDGLLEQVHPFRGGVRLLGVTLTTFDDVRWTRPTPLHM